MTAEGWVVRTHPLCFLHEMRDLSDHHHTVNTVSHGPVGALQALMKQSPESKDQSLVTKDDDQLGMPRELMPQGFYSFWEVLAHPN